MKAASFDTWESIFLFAAVQGILLGCMLLAKGKKWDGNYYLGACMLSFGVMLGYYVSYWTGYVKLLPKEIHFLGGLTFFIGPLLWQYIQDIQYPTNKVQTQLAKLALHFLAFPAYVLMLAVLPNYIASVFQCIQLSIYVFLIWKASQLIDPNNPFLKVVSIIKWGYLTYVIGFWAYYLLFWGGILAVEHDYFISMIMATVIYYIGFSGYQQTNAFIPKYNKAILPNNLSQEVKRKIIQYFEQEKPYLSGDFKLDNLSDKLGVSNQQLSQIINQQLGQSFSHFVNGYRIATAKEKLIQTNDKIEAIAYDSGFNNKVSFYQAFKKVTEQSPKQFRDSHQTQKQG